MTAWNRTAHPVVDPPLAADPTTAIDSADFVILSLFDGPACAEVLANCRAALSPGTVVVNTSTVGPDEATALSDEVTRTGAAYVHAPVLGSVSAVATGALAVLTGGRPAHVDRAEKLLSDLGETVHIGSPADAAAAKLVANGTLGRSLLGVRDSRQHASDLRLDEDQALAVLERSAHGRLVLAKRKRLADRDFTDADFAVGALAKDLDLLTRHSPAAANLATDVHTALTTGQVTEDDDISALCEHTTPAIDDGLTDIRLTTAPGVRTEAPAMAPLVAYATGHATGDPRHFEAAFLPTAHVEGLRDGQFVSWNLDEYYAIFTGRPAPDEPTRSRRVEHLSTVDTVGTASMTLWHGPDTFTDVFVLVRVDDRWWIANKAYQRRTAS